MKVTRTVDYNKEHMFACMGFPRGGTHYVQEVMKYAKFDVGHARIESEGNSDWRIILSLDKRVNPHDNGLTFDSNTPNKMCLYAGKSLVEHFNHDKYIEKLAYTNKYYRETLNKVINIKYKYKLFFVRNPWHTISTWTQMYEYPYGEGGLPSLVYFSKSGINFGEFNNAIHRSCIMFVEYAELMEKYADKVIRIENIFEELNQFFIENELEKHIMKPIEIKTWKGTFHGQTDFHNQRISKSEIEKNVSEELFNKISKFIGRIYK